MIIVTDGNCHDMGETTRRFVRLSKMPFSAIVIGVGDGEFDEMEILDADAEMLKDPEGNLAIRDIVQLVLYDDFAELGQRELASTVLDELPAQFMDYMVMKTNERYKLYFPEGFNEYRPDAAGEGNISEDSFKQAMDNPPEEESKHEHDSLQDQSAGGIGKIQLINTNQRS